MWLEVVLAVVAVAVACIYYSSRKCCRYFEERGIKYLPPVPVFGNFFKSTFHTAHLIDDYEAIYKAFPEEKYDIDGHVSVLASPTSERAIDLYNFYNKILARRDTYVGAVEIFNSIIVIRDPEIIKNITVKDFDHFVDHPNFSIEDPLFGNSLLLLRGQKWRDMRATLSPAFTGSKMRHMLPFMNEIAQQIVSYLHAELKPTDQGKISGELEMGDVIKRYANDVIASCAFGHKSNSVENKNNSFYTMGKSMTDFTAIQRIRFFFVFVFPKIAKLLNVPLFPEKAIKFFNHLVFGTMKYREENSIHRFDMLQLLIEAKNGTLKNTAPESDDKMGFATAEESNIHQKSVTREWKDIELAAQAFIFFFAGFESSSAVMTFAVHELAVSPEIQKKLRDEIDECHARHSELTYEVLKSLKYMDMVISETMRKWSPGIIMDREVTKEYTLDPPRPGAQPVLLKPKDTVHCLMNALHMDEKYFPEPKKFDPERFSDERKQNIQPFTYMPFGLGPRNCIGSRFALMEIKVLLYQLLLQFEVLTCSKTTDPVRMQPLSFSLRVANGSYLRLKAR